MKTINISFGLLILMSLATLPGSSAEKLSGMELKDRMRSLKLRFTGLDLGVYVYQRTLESYKGRQDQEKLAHRCFDMGITEVYLSFNGKSALTSRPYREKIQAFVVAFHGLKIRVLASFLDHKSLTGEKPLKEVLAGYSLFNQAKLASKRFDGICADIEPHILKAGRKIPESFKLRWDATKGYGKGKDNDLLVQQTISLLKQVRKAEPKTIFAQSIPHFFHHHAKSGDMSTGKVVDFLAPCDFVLLMAYSSSPKKIFDYAKEELKENGNKATVMIAVKTSIKTKGGGGDTTSLYGGGWTNLLIALDAIYLKAKKYHSFRGISFFEFEGLERMLTSK